MLLGAWITPDLLSWLSICTKKKERGYWMVVPIHSLHYDATSSIFLDNMLFENHVKQNTNRIVRIYHACRVPCCASPNKVSNLPCISPNTFTNSSMPVLAHFDSGKQNFLDGGVCCFLLLVVSPFVFWSYLVQEKCYLYIWLTWM